ncbi:MAG: endonuclease III [Desulfurobacteriaceae bacterium]
MDERQLLEKIREVARRLRERYPKAYRPGRTPVEQMVFTILSQNTTDRNAEKCLKNLKELTRGNLLKVPELPRDKVLEAIRPCGMFNQKLKALNSVLGDWERLERELKKLSEKEAIKLLTSYPFVGSKTARVVLTFAFGKNTFPIDTHCFRVLKRLGIFPDGWSREKISEFMESHFDAEFNRRFHYDLIRLGREFCRARNPRCKECPLRDLCSYPAKNSPRRGS